jgi:serine/threonine-protein kinase
MMEQEIPVSVFDDDPNVYVAVEGRNGLKWYYYDPDQKALGAGAMGKVFLGYDYDTNQRVAIKQLFDKYANVESIRERSRLEASLAYSHPNIVEMLGCCMYQDEEDFWHVWILSNYVDGVTIDKYVADMEGETRVVTVCSLICDALGALDYLHAKGVVHRDIKPSNIMVDRQSRAKLMDLGIARVTNANKYTTNGFVGTPLYASPEQIMRDKMQVQATPASDIYSLGMTLYVLLNGSHPFDAGTEAQILVNQMTKKLPGISSLPKKYRRLLPVIWKATDKDPENRYQNALDFKYAIEKALEPDATPWWWWLLGGVAALVVVALLLLIIL